MFSKPSAAVCECESGHLLTSTANRRHPRTGFPSLSSFDVLVPRRSSPHMPPISMANPSKARSASRGGPADEKMLHPPVSASASSGSSSEDPVFPPSKWSSSSKKALGESGRRRAVPQGTCEAVEPLLLRWTGRRRWFQEGQERHPAQSGHPHDMPELDRWTQTAV